MLQTEYNNASSEIRKIHMMMYHCVYLWHLFIGCHPMYMKIYIWAMPLHRLWHILNIRHLYAHLTIVRSWQAQLGFSSSWLRWCLFPLLILRAGNKVFNLDLNSQRRTKTQIVGLEGAWLRVGVTHYIWQLWDHVFLGWNWLWNIVRVLGVIARCVD